MHGMPIATIQTTVRQGADAGEVANGLKAS
jgi:hypothetical protein